eukprot:1758542-Rhodomonas_salina.2
MRLPCSNLRDTRLRKTVRAEHSAKQVGGIPETVREAQCGSKSRSRLDEPDKEGARLTGSGTGNRGPSSQLELEHAPPSCKSPL